ncbi:MAG TPA: FAD-dependent oxidoreductase, partial [Flavisolibacter sp.]|nr:FAD-dependent oxidoreductase [Flavisolibacter sp.]
MKRRTFIQSTALAGLAAALPSCKSRPKIKGAIRGASAPVGHLLRDKTFGEPSSVSGNKVVIVGAGISGLSAAYHLKKAGVEDFVLLDLEDNAGGNAAYGSNSTSAYPLGAHYIPLPNNSLVEYLDFLKEAGVITGYNPEGLPVYNELFLCFDPEERLYINGQWQEGLVPQFGVPEPEKVQIKNFLLQMDDYRHKIGKDGREAFALPVDTSSGDEALLQLDRQTMKEWLLQEGFSSAYLHGYVNYCTRDDFGTSYDTVSAWAGIHYFACRKGKGANAVHSDVLTWPEGNGWLVQQLEKEIKTKV